MKYEWRKKEKEMYIPKEKPQLITVPEQKFLMLKGKGNPNGQLFSEKIGVLYSLSYAFEWHQGKDGLQKVILNILSFH
jgi:hypothetical protein